MKLSALEYRFLLVPSFFWRHSHKKYRRRYFFCFQNINFILLFWERLKTCENATEKHKVDARVGNRVFHFSVRWNILRIILRHVFQITNVNTLNSQNKYIGLLCCCSSTNFFSCLHCLHNSWKVIKFIYWAMFGLPFSPISLLLFLFLLFCSFWLCRYSSA